MSATITVFGATGYTGQRVVRALVRDGVRPIIAGRSSQRLARLADDLGGLDRIVADSGQPDGTVRDLLDAGDVLITTVGPFVRHGGPALDAAVRAGAHYIDSTGEPSWIRRVFDVYGARATGRCALLPAVGYDYVPGNLAAGLALRDAGKDAVRVDVGYFGISEGGQQEISRGTASSVVGVMFEPSFAWRDGRLVEVRVADRVGSFEVDGRELEGVAVGGTEHLSLPRIWPQLREVNTYVGWLGPWAEAGSTLAAVPYALRHVPGARAVATRVGDVIADRVGATGEDIASGATEGGLGRVRVRAVAYDASDRRLAEVDLSGTEAYDFTGEIIAWAARRAAHGELEATGAVGPIEAFGLDELAAASDAIGLRRQRDGDG